GEQTREQKAAVGRQHPGRAGGLHERDLPFCLAAQRVERHVIAPGLAFRRAEARLNAGRALAEHEIELHILEDSRDANSPASLLRLVLQIGTSRLTFDLLIWLSGLVLVEMIAHPEGGDIFAVLAVVDQLLRGLSQRAQPHQEDNNAASIFFIASSCRVLEAIRAWLTPGTEASSPHPVFASSSGYGGWYCA